jgi:DNA-binding NarL/FixJ family response regulator
MNDKINVLLADDHHIVVEGLKEILKTAGNIAVAGVAYNGAELLKVARQTHAHLVILDINMPEMDGLQCTRHLKREFPDIKVLVLTMYNDRAFINEMINAGADGCMLKTKGAVELREAIVRIMHGKSYFDSLTDFVSDGPAATSTISEREVEIIKLIIKGMSSAEIALHLFISEHTVKTHRKNIFKKLGINHISQLTSIAINRGWG